MWPIWVPPKIKKDKAADILSAILSGKILFGIFLPMNEAIIPEDGRNVNAGILYRQQPKTTKNKITLAKRKGLCYSKTT